MFEFERLEVYSEIRKLNAELINLIKSKNTIDYFIKDQIFRASMSIALNIAEGAGRYTKNDKKHFYIIARGSLNESIAVLHSLLDLKFINELEYSGFYEKYTKISKMLSGLINSQK